MKGKQSVHNVPTDPNEGTDNIPGQYTIFDLEGIDNSLPVRRYTIAEFARQLLILAIFDANSGIPPTICINCLRMAMGELPCPHDCFPEDPREHPRLVWPSEERAHARGGTVSPVGSPVQAAGSSREHRHHSSTSDSFVDNQAQLATPPGPSRLQSHSHAAPSSCPSGHRSRAAALASPPFDSGTTTTVNWFPCSFSHRHASTESTLRCNSRAMLQTYEQPPPAPVSASTEHALSIAIARSGEPHEDDEDTWSTISPTLSTSASASTPRPPANRTPASSSASTIRSGRAPGQSRASTDVRTGVASATTSRHTTHAVRHQPAEEHDPSVPAEHPLVPIPAGVRPILVEHIFIAEENPGKTVWYVVTTSSTVGVFDSLTVAQNAAQVSRGSWHRASSHREVLADFHRAVADNTVVVRL